MMGSLGLYSYILYDTSTVGHFTLTLFCYCGSPALLIEIWSIMGGSTFFVLPSPLSLGELIVAPNTDKDLL